jgi:predicted phosphoribosyltransferase
MSLYRDRADAGRQVAARLRGYKGNDDILVLGLPCGGVPVAFEIATAIEAPLDVLCVRKLGTPDQPELAAAVTRLIDLPDLRDRVRVFRDRGHAGRLLSEILGEYRHSDALVMAIPAGENGPDALGQQRAGALVTDPSEKISE